MLMELNMAMIGMKENFEGRIRNVSLSSSTPGNALVPVFEAISNSLFAIHARFGDDRAKYDGKISVLVERGDDDHVYNFEITDNGIGLTESNFVAFQTLDTNYKTKGKGIGRLTWLKVFESCNIVSVFTEGGQKRQRSFLFFPSNVEPFKEYKDRISESPNGTRVRLNKMRLDYAAHCPSKPETIAKRIIAHFFPQFFSNELPTIHFAMGDYNVILSELLREKIYRPASSILDFEGVELKLYHWLVDRSVIDQIEHHSILFSGDDRIVEPYEIDAQIGLAQLIPFSDKQCRYIGIASSKLLDDALLQERNRFDFSSERWESIKRVALEAAKGYLSDEIKTVVTRQKNSLASVLKSFPRFSYLVHNTEEFVDNRIPLNASNEEDIYKHLSILDFRESREVTKILAKHVTRKESLLEQIDQQSKQLVDKIQEQERSALLEYMAKRKLILQLLEQHQGFENEDEKTRFLELSVHRIICPTRIDKHDISIDAHNLWVIDDRLAYYDFWASDKRIKDVIAESDSEERPDVILFSGQTLYKRSKTNQPIVIIEFKRPARRNYDDEENPLSQVYGYIRELRAKSVNDKGGKLIMTIDKMTPFFCYIIADITPRLQEILEEQSVNKPLPGGRGFFGFNETYNAFIEVLHYESLIEDARLRNELFFEKLGIS